MKSQLNSKKNKGRSIFLPLFLFISYKLFNVFTYLVLLILV